MVDSQSISRTEQVMRTIRQRIDRRALTPGARLPSVRSMAESIGFSKSTIVEAYERLTAEGVIRSRPGSGFYVAAQLAPLALAEINPASDTQVDPLWMLRHSLSTGGDALRPGCGWLPQSWMAEESIRKGLRQLTRGTHGTSLVDYGTAAGCEPLRRLIAHRLIDQGVEAGPDQILLTDSGTHAIDLVLRFLIEPGDVVLVDDPCFFNFHALLRAHRAKVVAVPMTPAGPDVDRFASLVADHAPRLYLTNSGIHNPTGVSLSAATAHSLLKIADAHDLAIIEDDIFADFEVETAPRLAALDGLQRVIRVGSFSKTLSSAVRCGYIAARREWIGDITDLRIATGLSGNTLSAELLRSVLTDGSYRRHMEKVRARLEQARRRAIARLRTIGVEPWIEPAAGLFLWCRLPDGIDATEVARRALADGIIFAPGNVFSLSHTATRYMRFNAAMMDDERIYAVLERACADVMRDAPKFTQAA